VIAMTKDLNPPTPFLFPGVGEQAIPSMAARSPDRRVIKDRTPGAPRLDFPFLSGRGRRFFKFSM
jgi:hypothetical protein